MTRIIIATLFALAFCQPAAAQEHDVKAYTVDGEKLLVQFLGQDGETIQLSIDGVVRSYDIAEIAVVIFDNGFTNFYTDKEAHLGADPHMVCQKEGYINLGLVTSVVPDHQAHIITNGLEGTIDTFKIARIYYNPRPFFKAAIITADNKVKFRNDDDGENKHGKITKKGEKKPGKGKKNGEKGGKKKVKEPSPEALAGGEVYIKMRSGATTRGVIVDILGSEKLLELADGRRFNLTNIAFINYVEVKDVYEADKGRLAPGVPTFILRNGAVVSGRIIDYRGASGGYWELEGGRRVEWQQVARIHMP